MALPRVLKAFAAFVDGTNYMGEVPEVTLPTLSRKMEEYRAGGMQGPVDLDFGQEKMEAELKGAGWLKDLAKKRDAHAFVRPHELHVQPWRAGEAGIAATITRALCIGPTARLELTPLHGEGILEAEMPNAEWLSLALKEGDRVLAKAQTARVFVMQGADI